MNTKKSTKKPTAAKPAKSKGAANKTKITTPPAAFGKVEAAVANMAPGFGDWFSELVKSVEPRESEIEAVRADLGIAIKSGTAWMFPSFARLAKEKASKARERAEIVRKVTRWIRGGEPLPEGATQADVVLRGVAWDGWEWSLRGQDVSRPTPETIDDADRRAECFRRVEKEAAEVLAWRIANGKPARDNPVTAAREAAEEYFDALEAEDEAWCELSAAEKNARATLPAAELANAKARLDGRPVSTQIVSPPPSSTSDAKGCNGVKTPDELAAAALKWKKREAVKAWRKAHAERNRIHRITRETREEKWGSFWNWVRAPGSGFRDVADMIEEEEFWRILDSVRHR